MVAILEADTTHKKRRPVDVKGEGVFKYYISMFT